MKNKNIEAQAKFPGSFKKRVYSCIRTPCDRVL